jgi:nucleoside-diphosphate-sugar epimerase
MNVAITGATGFIGRYIVTRLAGQGDRCRLLHRVSSDRGGFAELAGDAGRLHGHARHFAGVQPVRRGQQVPGHGPEGPDLFDHFPPIVCTADAGHNALNGGLTASA